MVLKGAKQEMIVEERMQIGAKERENHLVPAVNQYVIHNNLSVIHLQVLRHSHDSPLPLEIAYWQTVPRYLQIEPEEIGGQMNAI
jgi:hypothetical protein